MDLHFLIFLFPAGVIYCFKELRDEHLFVITYALVASYFAGVMVRLMLTLTPVVCVAAAVSLSSLLDTYLDPYEPKETEEELDVSEVGPPATPSPPVTGAPNNASASAKRAKKAASSVGPSVQVSSLSKRKFGIFGIDSRIMVVVNTCALLIFFVLHCTYVTSSAYSSPSVVLASQRADGSQHIIDDFREAYYWLRQNTPETSVVMSWWDYGYQIAGMADRPTMVDNNTWNNSELRRVDFCDAG